MTSISSTDASSQSLLLQLLQQMRAAASQTSETASTSSDSSSTSSSISELFSSIDTDGDGQISKTEYSSFADQFATSTASALISAQEGTEADGTEASALSFEDVDANGDGAISEDELASALPPPPPDGGMSASLSDLFSAIDTDGDGAISEDELETALASLQTDTDEAATETASSTTASPSSASTGGAGAAGGSSETYDPLDTNEDGVVSAAERAAANGTSVSALSGKLGSSTFGALLDSIAA